MLAQIGVLIDESFPCHDLPGRGPNLGVCRGGGESDELPDKVHLAGVARDIDQLITRVTIAVHVAVEDVAAVARAAVFEVDTNAGRTDTHKVSLVTEDREEARARRKL